MRESGVGWWWLSAQLTEVLAGFNCVKGLLPLETPMALLPHAAYSARATGAIRKKEKDRNVANHKVRSSPSTRDPAITVFGQESQAHDHRGDRCLHQSHGPPPGARPILAGRRPSLFVSWRRSRNRSRDPGPKNAPEYLKGIDPADKELYRAVTERFWNDAEHAGAKSNAITGREWTLPIPCELDKQEAEHLVRSFAQDYLVEKGMVAQYAIHEPSEKNDVETFTLTF